MNRALLLAAGNATRLIGWRDHYAKATVPVAGTTALSHLLDAVPLTRAKEVWINLHRHAEQVRAHALAHPLGAAVRFFTEPTLLGTGGTLLAVSEDGSSVPTWVANAKMLTDFDWSLLDRLAAGTVVLHTASALGEFGGFRYDAEERCTGLLTRADAATAPSGSAAVYTGICRPHPDWIECLRRARAARPDAVLCMVRDGLLPAMAGGSPVRVHLHRGAWYEISTPQRLAAAAAAWRQLSPVAPQDRAAPGSHPAAP